MSVNPQLPEVKHPMKKRPGLTGITVGIIVVAFFLGISGMGVTASVIAGSVVGMVFFVVLNN